MDNLTKPKNKENSFFKLILLLFFLNLIFTHNLNAEEIKSDTTKSKVLEYDNYIEKSINAADKKKYNKAIFYLKKSKSDERKLNLLINLYHLSDRFEEAYYYYNKPKKKFNFNFNTQFFLSDLSIGEKAVHLKNDNIHREVIIPTFGFVSDLFFEARLNKHFKFFSGYSIASVKMNPIINTTFNDFNESANWTQQNLYGSIKYFFPQLEFIVFTNIISLNYVSINQTFDFYSNKMFYYKNPSSSGGFALGSGIKYNHSLFNWKLNASALIFNKAPYPQLENTLKFYLTGNDRLTLHFSNFLLADSASTSFPIELCLTGKLNKKFWLNGFYFYGDNRNLVKNDGAEIYSIIDHTKYVAGIFANISIGKFIISPHIITSDRYNDVFVIKDNFNNTYSYLYETFSYRRNNFLINIKYNL